MSDQRSWGFVLAKCHTVVVIRERERERERRTDGRTILNHLYKFQRTIIGGTKLNLKSMF